MSEHSLLVADRTKRYDIPLGHLDYGYIDTCTDTKELERILVILRSGEEGIYPDLEKTCEEKLTKLNPKSRVLRKSDPLLKSSDLGKNEWEEIDQGLQDWTSTMKNMDDSFSSKKVVQSKAKGEEFDDDDLPPIRSSVTSVNGTAINGTANEPEEIKKSSQKRVKPRDWKEWDKFDVDKELEKVEEDGDKKKEKTVVSKAPDIDRHISSTGMSDEEKLMKATREKDKGNEAFRAGDHEEAILYYSRSISLMQTAACINNRALAYLKIQKWDKALFDCRVVLDMEPENIKAFLRRGSAYKGKKDYTKARADFQRALELEPANKRAEELLDELKTLVKEEEEEKKQRKEKGRRMVIEDVEGEEEDGKAEDHVNKSQGQPQINGSSSAEALCGDAEKSEKRVGGDDHVSNGEGSEVTNSGKNRDSLAGETAECDRLASPNASDVTEQERSDKVTSSSDQKTSEIGDKVINPDVKLDQNYDERTSPGDTGHVHSAGVSQVNSKDIKTVDSETENVTKATEGEDNNVTTKVPERPVLVQTVLPSNVAPLRESGNTLFRCGQYGDALSKYSSAIEKLEIVKSDQAVNLSLLYSNRAACELKVGNCSASIKDCRKALDLVPHSIKPLLRRGSAYETLERYREAYVDYKHVLTVDPSVESAFTGSTRCQNALREQDGIQWREKLPPLESVSAWEVPLVVDTIGNPVNRSVTTPTAQSVPIATANEKAATEPEGSVSTSVSSSSTSSSSATSSETELTTEQKFENAKSEGNKCVQKGDFVKAVDWYTECISLMPDRTVGYTNRALCYLRRNQVSSAEDDCSKALEMEADNIKALFRRSQARKMLKKYKDSLEDLTNLLKVDPKNTAAKKEMTLVKNYYREELQKMKDNLSSSPSAGSSKAAGGGKQRKRMVIQETESDEEEDSSKVKISDVKSSEVKFSPKEKVASKTQAASPKKPETKTEKKGKKIVIEEIETSDKDSGKHKAPGISKTSQKSEKRPNQSKNIKPTSTGLPVVPPSVPKLDKATPYEFIQAWNSLKKVDDLQPYADLLKQISPAEIPKVISNKLDGPMLTTIVQCLESKFTESGELETAYSILTNLSKVQRFKTISMFMSKPEKSGVQNILTRLQNQKSEVYDQSDLNKLKKCYEIR
ncbi:sperm-associated antigen 1-like [Mizuhopecten yessoensis]|uniref:Sperm-associated antigen 1 n=1 Tax=Mizuhopecten yessoensis TaxID=6573 RepID=A0A210QL56_MIZYE|nr:sperm-associated antigen 1-like [Mizuhopecten yessoensis]XP_021355707.1 sperm-associated antigen 1-like [Mizuhopecten yessoensis]XP_021355708.1 sperm-associated antigen 1-like [Mizuhopecten yessoensis]OWF49446.1 Sperm-associated antigen 1 [Mizuhopecten yessoensis]